MTITAHHIDTREKFTFPARITKAPHNRSRTGYGGKIPTRYLVQWRNRWRRVYVACWSNAGTAYIDDTRTPAPHRWIVIDDVQTDLTPNQDSTT